MSEVAVSAAEPQPPPCGRAASRQAWVERLERFAASGLSPSQFCAREGIALPTFYSWRRRLVAEADAPTAEAGPRLLPVRLAASPAPLELALPGGAVLRIGPGADPDSLRLMLGLLGVTPC
jgi:hypothetical protein